MQPEAPASTGVCPEEPYLCLAVGTIFPPLVAVLNDDQLDTYCS